MKRYLTIITTLLLLSCLSPPAEVNVSDRGYTFGTQSDSALYYFRKGNEYQLDYGQYILSEAAYRKAVDFDSTFVLGKCFLGWIIRNPQERLRLQNEIIRDIDKTTPDDRLLVDVALDYIRLYNSDELRIPYEGRSYSEAAKMGEDKFRVFVYRHPEVSYIKAMYIGSLAGNHGAAIAQDSLVILTTADEKALPFYTLYRVKFEAENGNFDRALELSDSLKLLIDNPDIPVVYALLGSIYYQMDSLDQAVANLDMALKLDSNDSQSEWIKRRVQWDLNEIKIRGNGPRPQ